MSSELAGYAGYLHWRDFFGSQTETFLK